MCLLCWEQFLVLQSCLTSAPIWKNENAVSNREAAPKALPPVHSQPIYPSNQASKWWCLQACCEGFREPVESTFTKELFRRLWLWPSLVNVSLRFALSFKLRRLSTPLARQKSKTNSCRVLLALLAARVGSRTWWSFWQNKAVRVSMKIMSQGGYRQNVDQYHRQHILTHGRL